MVHVITAAFVIGLIIVGALTLTDASLSSASDLSLSWPQMVERSGDIARTELTLIQADIGGGGVNVDISFRNSGQTALADFSKWDVVIQYYATSSNQGLNLSWLSHTTSAFPSNNQWTVSGIYLDAGTLEAEVYEPNIFNHPKR